VLPEEKTVVRETNILFITSEHYKMHDIFITSFLKKKKVKNVSFCVT